MLAIEANLEEVELLQVNDDYLESNGLTAGTQNSMSGCSICSCNLLACGG